MAKCKFNDHGWCRLFVDEVTTIKDNYVKTRNAAIRCSEAMRRQNLKCPFEKED